MCAPLRSNNSVRLDLSDHSLMDLSDLSLMSLEDLDCCEFDDCDIEQPAQHYPTEAETHQPLQKAIVHRPPFLVTAIYLFTQFNVSVYLSQTISLTILQWIVMNCAVVTFLFSAKKYRKVMAQMRVKGEIPLSVAEIITGATLVLLVLQLRTVAFLVLVGGLLYMGLATFIGSIYLLTAAVGDPDDAAEGDYVTTAPAQRRLSWVPTHIIV